MRPFQEQTLSKLQAIRGMNDLLPADLAVWQHVESQFRTLMARYGYSEIRTPIVEQTALFKRSIGEATDVVEKEMYTFDDRNGSSLTLRPENTAAVVRAALQHGLLHHQAPRLWYLGPMFRHERPQKGRYRQFHQFGAEAFNMEGPDIDAEIILMTARLWKALGIRDQVTLELNSLGSNEARMAYRERLTAYLEQHYDLLDEDSKRRLVSNPLRVLDSKNPAMATMLAGAPILLDYLDSASRAHFDALTARLDSAGVPFTVNPRLVRGLDYYNRTVFEWTTTALGSQGTVCAGGRYDGLVDQLGGRGVPAVGFAIGVERLVLLLDALDQIPAESRHTLDAYLTALSDTAQQQALALAERLRDEAPSLRLQLHCGGGSVKQQLKKADQSGATIALILGEDECQAGTVSIKYLREERAQETVMQDALADHLARALV